MTRLTMSALIAGCLLVSSALAQGQVVKKTVEQSDHDGTTIMMSADDVMFLPGVGAVVTSDGKRLKIDFIAPAENRDPAFKEVDLQEGDILMMVNGKRMKTIEQLRELFEALEVGAEIKLGLKRDKGMVMTSMTKADASQMGGMVMQITQDVEEGPDGGPGKMITKTMSFGGGDNAVVPLMGLGIMLTDSDDNLIVGPKMQIQGMKVPETDLQPDDIVLSINDQAVKSAEQFSPIYDAIATGEQVSLKIKRGEKTLTVTFAKPGMGDMKIIRKSGK